MSDSLPTEILATIIEDVISEYAMTMPTNHRIIRFIPRWYLAPILRVSRQWNTVCAKYLYCSVAVGGSAPFDFPAIEGEPYFKTDGRRQLHVSRTSLPIRTGYEVTEELYQTLSTNAGLTAFITTLQLGIEPDDQKQDQHTWALKNAYLTPQTKPEWTKTHIRILQLCQNVEHVDIRGFEQSKLDALVDVLKEKSLVSLSLTTWDLAYSIPGQRNGGSFLQILGMMQKWPKLQSIRAEKFLRQSTKSNRWLDSQSSRVVNFMDEVSEPEDDPETLDALESLTTPCCPDLREIVITGASLRASELRRVRGMCSGRVTKFAVSLDANQGHGCDDAARDALCECLRAWSQTLEYLRMDASYHDPYPPFNEVISTLRRLRELQLGRMKVDFSSIYRLQLLERFACITPHSKEEVQPLVSYLEDSESFPSLECLILRFDHVVVPNKVEDLCYMRNIEFGSFQTLGFIL